MYLHRMRRMECAGNEKSVIQSNAKHTLPDQIRSFVSLWMALFIFIATAIALYYY